MRACCENGGLKMRGASPAFSLLTRLLSHTSTINQLNAVLIGCENRMTPGEEEAVFQGIMGYPLSSPPIRHFVTAIGLRLSASPFAKKSKHHKSWDAIKSLHIRRWAHSLWQHSRMAGELAHASPWSAWHRGEVSFYRHESGRGRLIVAFSGGQSRFGMRTPTLLRFFRVLESDVLLLKTPHREPYSNGVRGVGSSFVDVMEWIHHFSQEKNYGDVVVTGISKGALAACATAGYLGASRSVVLGLPHSPEALDKLAATPEDEAIVRQAVMGTAASVPTVIVYSEGAQKDRLASQELFEQVSQGRLVEVEDSPHAMLWPLAKKGKLVSSLFDWFDSAVEKQTERDQDND
jgi:hypothetical protein